MSSVDTVFKGMCKLAQKFYQSITEVRITPCIL